VLERVPHPFAVAPEWDPGGASWRAANPNNHGIGVPRSGIEPLAYRLGGGRSIRLSYRGVGTEPCVYRNFAFVLVPPPYPSAWVGRREPVIRDGLEGSA
jgi:hypothetical protein